MATWLKADGSTIEVAAKSGKKFSLEELQMMVGGYIELVRLPGRKNLLVNEDGLLLNLPPNNRASAHANRLIVGDAVLVGPGEM